jgi:o-succinylbenzoate---CoA ligase
VLLRCVAAGTEPAFVDLHGGFTAAALATAVRSMRGDRRYTALVPTQLTRALADADATAALASLDAVLVGGAATAPQVLARARDHGIRAVTTYGMSETCGGCVYDGTPLRGATVRLDDEQRLHVGGRTLATGYLGRPDLTATVFSAGPDGTRWFRTDDTGHVDADGRWHVDGRLDDLVNTGGLKVAPRLVEEALAGLDAVAEAVVVGTPDDEWGEVVSAAVVLHQGATEPTLAQLREALRGMLPEHALPRRLAVVGTLPQRGPGKPDRVAIRGIFSSRGVTP